MGWGKQDCRYLDDCIGRVSELHARALHGYGSRRVARLLSLAASFSSTISSAGGRTVEEVELDGAKRHLSITASVAIRTRSASDDEGRRWRALREARSEVTFEIGV